MAYKYGDKLNSWADAAAAIKGSGKKKPGKKVDLKKELDDLKKAMKDKK